MVLWCNSRNAVATMASIRGRSGDHACTGVPVAQNAVLAVAHCLVENELEFPKVLLKTLGSDGWKGASNENFSSFKAVVHPSYNGVAGSEFDLAIVLFDGSTNLPVYTLAQDKDCFESDETCKIHMYLWSEPESQIPLEGLSHATCEELRPDRFTVNNVCAKSVQAGACQSTAGAPLVSEGTLIGLTLQSQDCGDPGRPHVFASIPALFSWIKDALEMKSESSTPTKTSEDTDAGPDEGRAHSPSAPQVVHMVAALVAACNSDKCCD